MGFIENVNALVNIQDILQSIKQNIEEIKNVESNDLAIKKVASLENSISTIKDNIDTLVNINSSLSKIAEVESKLSEIENANKNISTFTINFQKAESLVSRLRNEIDEIFVLNPQIKSIYEDVVTKNANINKNILIAQQSSTSASSSAAVAVAAKNAIEEKYEVYQIAITFKSSIEALALNIQEIKDAITITSQNKNTTAQNAQITTSDKNLVKQYKDEVVENRNVSLTLRDATIKASNDAKEIANQINRQSASNAKLAFTVHNVATRLSIEFSNLIVAVKKMQEEKEIELDLFAENLTQNLNLEIANAKSIVSKDVVTSQKIVSEISANLSLLTEAKHRENKNEIRFKNSELVSLLAVSKMMMENKIISDNTANQILEFENKLKGYEHEKIKNLLNSLTADKRVELLVAKGLLTDIKLQTL